MLIRIAIIVTLGFLTAPGSGYGQVVRRPTGAVTTRIRPDSVQARTKPPPPAPAAPGEDYGSQIPTRMMQPRPSRSGCFESGDDVQTLQIPPVVGMTVREAINSFAWTKLNIVQVKTTTRKYAPGLVASQIPRGGAPINGVCAETLFVAVAPPKPESPPICWACILRPPRRPPVETPPSPPKGQPPGVSPPAEPEPTPTPEPTPPPRVVQERTIVPDLFQNTPDMVLAALKRSRLNLTNLGADYSEDVPRGRVFRQQPAAGEEVATSTYVGVWYSNGPHPVAATFKVPRVVGLELADATDSLKRSGFRAGSITFLTRPDAEKRVVHQSPAEGETAHRNDAVDLTITTRPAQVAVPSVITLTREAARQRLGNVGLGVGRYTLVVRTDSRSGIVSQRPSAGSQADSGSLVDLEENRPPEVRRVTVPNLSGRTVAASERMLRSAGLVLGEVLRPALNAVDRVIEQRPQPGETALMNSAVIIGLDVSAGPPPERMIRIPAVVNFSVDSARRTLTDSGFTKISIGGAGDRFASGSIVESQTPPAGTFATPGTLLSLIAHAPAPLPPMPNLVGQRRDVADVVAELDSLRMIVVSEIRSFRLRDEVVRQYPEAQRPRRADNTVDVFVEIPIVPPPVALAVLGLGVVGGVGGESVRRWRRRNRATSAVTLKPIASEPAAPELHAEALGSLIKASFTLHFGVESSPSTLEVQGDSLVKPEK